MNKQMIRNKAKLMNSINRKKMYKHGKQWVVASTVFLALLGAGYGISQSTIHADTDSNASQITLNSDKLSTTKANSNNANNKSNAPKTIDDNPVNVKGTSEQNYNITPRVRFIDGRSYYKNGEDPADGINPSSQWNDTYASPALSSNTTTNVFTTPQLGTSGTDTLIRPKTTSIQGGNDVNPGYILADHFNGINIKLGSNTNINGNKSNGGWLDDHGYTAPSFDYVSQPGDVYLRYEDEDTHKSVGNLIHVKGFFDENIPQSLINDNIPSNNYDYSVDSSKLNLDSYHIGHIPNSDPFGDPQGSINNGGTILIELQAKPITGTLPIILKTVNASDGSLINYSHDYVTVGGDPARLNNTFSMPSDEATTGLNLDHGLYDAIGNSLTYNPSLSGYTLSNVNNLNFSINHNPTLDSGNNFNYKDWMNFTPTTDQNKINASSPKYYDQNFLWSNNKTPVFVRYQDGPNEPNSGQRIPYSSLVYRTNLMDPDGHIFKWSDTHSLPSKTPTGTVPFNTHIKIDRTPDWTNVNKILNTRNPSDLKYIDNENSPYTFNLSDILAYDTKEELFSKSDGSSNTVIYGTNDWQDAIKDGIKVDSNLSSDGVIAKSDDPNKNEWTNYVPKTQDNKFYYHNPNPYPQNTSNIGNFVVDYPGVKTTINFVDSKTGKTVPFTIDNKTVSQYQTNFGYDDFAQIIGDNGAFEGGSNPAIRDRIYFRGQAAESTGKPGSLYGDPSSNIRYKPLDSFTKKPINNGLSYINFPAGWEWDSTAQDAQNEGGSEDGQSNLGDSTNYTIKSPMNGTYLPKDVNGLKGAQAFISTSELRNKLAYYESYNSNPDLTHIFTIYVHKTDKDQVLFNYPPVTAAAKVEFIYTKPSGQHENQISENYYIGSHWNTNFRNHNYQDSTINLSNTPSYSPSTDPVSVPDPFYFWQNATSGLYAPYLINDYRYIDGNGNAKDNLGTNWPHSDTVIDFNNIQRYINENSGSADPSKLVQNQKNNEPMYYYYNNDNPTTGQSTSGQDYHKVGTLEPRSEISSTLPLKGNEQWHPVYGPYKIYLTSPNIKVHYRWASAQDGHNTLGAKASQITTGTNSSDHDISGANTPVDSNGYLNIDPNTNNIKTDSNGNIGSIFHIGNYSNQAAINDNVPNGYTPNGNKYLSSELRCVGTVSVPSFNFNNQDVYVYLTKPKGKDVPNITPKMVLQNYIQFYYTKDGYTHSIGNRFVNNQANLSITSDSDFYKNALNKFKLNNLFNAGYSYVKSTDWKGNNVSIDALNNDPNPDKNDTEKTYRIYVTSPDIVVHYRWDTTNDRHTSGVTTNGQDSKGIDAAQIIKNNRNSSLDIPGITSSTVQDGHLILNDDGSYKDATKFGRYNLRKFTDKAAINRLDQKLGEEVDITGYYSVPKWSYNKQNVYIYLKPKTEIQPTIETGLQNYIQFVYRKPDSSYPGGIYTHNIGTPFIDKDVNVNYGLDMGSQFYKHAMDVFKSNGLYHNYRFDGVDGPTTNINGKKTDTLSDSNSGQTYHIYVTSPDIRVHYRWDSTNDNHISGVETSGTDANRKDASGIIKNSRNNSLDIPNVTSPVNHDGHLTLDNNGAYNGATQFNIDPYINKDFIRKIGEKLGKYVEVSGYYSVPQWSYDKQNVYIYLNTEGNGNPPTQPIQPTKEQNYIQFVYRKPDSSYPGGVYTSNIGSPFTDIDVNKPYGLGMGSQFYKHAMNVFKSENLYNNYRYDGATGSNGNVDTLNGNNIGKTYYVYVTSPNIRVHYRWDSTNDNHISGVKTSGTDANGKDASGIIKNGRTAKANESQIQSLDIPNITSPVVRDGHLILNNGAYQNASSFDISQYTNSDVLNKIGKKLNENIQLVGYYSVPKWSYNKQNVYIYLKKTSSNTPKQPTTQTYQNNIQYVYEKNGHIEDVGNPIKVSGPLGTSHELPTSQDTLDSDSNLSKYQYVNTTFNNDNYTATKTSDTSDTLNNNNTKNNDTYYVFITSPDITVHYRLQGQNNDISGSQTPNVTDGYLTNVNLDGHTFNGTPFTVNDMQNYENNFNSYVPDGYKSSDGYQVSSSDQNGVTEWTQQHQDVYIYLDKPSNPTPPNPNPQPDQQQYHNYVRFYYIKDGYVQQLGGQATYNGKPSASYTFNVGNGDAAQQAGVENDIQNLQFVPENQLSGYNYSDSKAVNGNTPITVDQGTNGKTYDVYYTSPNINVHYRLATTPDGHTTSNAASDINSSASDLNNSSIVDSNGHLNVVNGHINGGTPFDITGNNNSGETNPNYTDDVYISSNVKSPYNSGYELAAGDTKDGVNGNGYYTVTSYGKNSQDVYIYLMQKPNNGGNTPAKPVNPPHNPPTPNKPKNNGGNTPNTPVNPPHNNPNTPNVPNTPNIPNVPTNPSTQPSTQPSQQPTKPTQPSQQPTKPTIQPTRQPTKQKINPTKKHQNGKAQIIFKLRKNHKIVKIINIHGHIGNHINYRYYDNMIKKPYYFDGYGYHDLVVKNGDKDVIYLDRNGTPKLQRTPNVPKKNVKLTPKFTPTKTPSRRGQMPKKLPQTNEPTVHTSVFAVAMASISAVLAFMGRCVRDIKHQK